MCFVAAAQDRALAPSLLSREEAPGGDAPRSRPHAGAAVGDTVWEKKVVLPFLVFISPSFALWLQVVRVLHVLPPLSPLFFILCELISLSFFSSFATLLSYPLSLVRPFFSATLSLSDLSCVNSPPPPSFVLCSSPFPLYPPSFSATLPPLFILPLLRNSPLPFHLPSPPSLVLRSSPFPLYPPCPPSLVLRNSPPFHPAWTHPLLLPPGINVFAVILHTHLLGRKVRVRHLRDGRELEPIAQDNNYDFNYQEYRALNTPRTVLPVSGRCRVCGGDHLIGECTYNSRERSTITLGGFKTRDEMCLSFLFYWPRVDLSLCHSKPSLNTVLHSLGIQELSADSDPIKIRRPIELSGKTLEWRLLNYDWKNQFEYFQAATHTGTINPMCWRRGESLLPELEKMDYDYPNITEPWAPENGLQSHIEDRIENDHFEGFGVEDTGTADRELTEELLDMERELGKELANKAQDHFQEQTARPASGGGRRRGGRSWPRCACCASTASTTATAEAPARGTAERDVGETKVPIVFVFKKE
ncbi:putative MOXD1-like 2 [Penaeus vannamei]|uniref:Putative MOXD1-like 2 n=1 Tax=Penaeus vannamei TaxID=6689 RepID=A0A423UBF7_PENVA|nr:putative MOXD1-like 2 [Penaeus vannamei]